MPAKRTTVARVCQQCGADFQARTDGPGRYCSNSCKFAAMRLPSEEKRARERDQRRANYLKNREARLQAAREYRTDPAMRDKVVQYGRRYYEANRSDLLARHREYDAIPENRARRLAYQTANRDRYATLMAMRRSEKYGLNEHFLWTEWAALKRRAGYACLRCGAGEDSARLTVDHIVPLHRGGTNLIDNIQPLCGRCNRAKGTSAIDYRFDLMQRPMHHNRFPS